MALGGSVPCTTLIFTPAFSSTVVGSVSGSPGAGGGTEKTQEVPYPPWERVQESRLNFGAVGSASSRAVTIRSCKSVMYSDMRSRIGLDSSGVAIVVAVCTYCPPVKESFVSCRNKMHSII